VSRPAAIAGDEQPPGTSPAGEAPPPFWEWVAAGVGLLLLLASMGYLLADSLAARDEPPRPAIQVRGVEPRQGQYAVRLRVRNEGRAAAAALRVTGELKRGEEVVESTEIEIDFLPGRSEREATLLFAQDPRTLQLVLSPRSYVKP